MLGREGYVGKNVVLALAHQRGELGPARPELIGNMTPGLMCRLVIGLQEGLADRGGDHGVLTFGHMCQGVAHPMNAASLPGRTKYASDRVAQTVMSVGDHQIDALETALDQALEKARPEGLGFRGADAKTDDLASSFGCDRHGDDCRDRDDAAAIADLEIGGVEPQIWPLAVDRPVEESVDPLVDVFAQLRSRPSGSPPESGRR